MLKNEKMAREIDDRKSVYVDETNHQGKSRKEFVLIFYGLEPSHMDDVDVCKVSKVWVG